MPTRGTRLTIAATLCLLALHGAASGLTWYVATNGNDAVNDGLSTNVPLRTVSAAAARIGPGDTVFLRKGIYRETLTISNYGAPGAPITFASYTGEVASIRGSDIVTDWRLHTNSTWVHPDWHIDPQLAFDDGLPLTRIGYITNLPPNYYTLYGTGLNHVTFGPISTALRCNIAHNDGNELGRPRGDQPHALASNRSPSTAGIASIRAKRYQSHGFFFTSQYISALLQYSAPPVRTVTISSSGCASTTAILAALSERHGLPPGGSDCVLWRAFWSAPRGSCLPSLICIGLIPV